MRGLATSARFTLIARLLQESAAQTGTQLPDLTGLFPLIRLERALTLTDTSLTLGFPTLRMFADLVRGLGRNGALPRRLPARRRGRRRG